MKKSDIVWGGDHKAVVKLQSPISGMQIGDVVKLEYDYDLNSYILKYELNSAPITPVDKVSENQLELVLKGHYIITILLDFLEETVCILRLQVFEQRIELGKLSNLKILLTDDVVSRLSDSEQREPIKVLEEKFVYTDSKTGDRMIFVKGYGRKQADFSLLSLRNMLHIRKQDDVYTAEKLVRYDRSKAEWDAVSLIVGTIEFVDSTRNAQVSASTASEMKKISSSGTYFDIWNAYQNLETISLLQRAREVGVLKYNSVSCSMKSDGYEYLFCIDADAYANFSDGELIDCCEKDIINDSDIKPENIRKYKTKVAGNFVSLSNGTCIIFDTLSDRPKNMPQSGYLFTSLTGDFIRFQRCEIARDKILGNTAEIGYLKTIIEDGTTAHNQIGYEKAITNRLKEQFPNYTFNAEQEKAIDNAINTPDLSLVLGPPGTGKTTVIKAIIIRFAEWFKKHTEDEVPKILISSFQHVAVDNAAKGAQNDGLPPNRTGGKQDGKDSLLVYIDTWRREKSKKLEPLLDQAENATAENTDTLRDMIFAWSEKGKSVDEGIAILKTQLDTNVADISKELTDEAQKLLAHYGSSVAKSPKMRILEEEDDEYRRNILLSQRITKEAFADDGIKQARRFKSELEYSGLFESADTAVVQKVIETKGADEKAFKDYVQLVENLKEKYVKPSVPVDETEYDIAHNLEQILKRIDGELREKRFASIQNSASAETIILRQFLNLIQDDNEVKRIIKEYSSISAATCQQAMDIHYNATEKRYDLVLIDEAARANPLDLMIPLSMGKKVILVGDHKQLPHMLSPEVVKEFEKGNRQDELGILKKSLFERLFEMLERSGNGKRTVRLSKQYRMHPSISDFASRCFYSNGTNTVGLDSSDMSDEQRKEKEARLGLYNDKPLVFIDLPRELFGSEEKGQSKARKSEAEFVIKEVAKVLQKDSAKSVGIITFYGAQRDRLAEYAETLLSDSQRENVEIGTVDAFQGKEFDVVFLSCARANSFDDSDLRKKVGFVMDKNRLCVAFTRARQLLVAVGDADTMQVVPAMKDLITLCKAGEEGFYESAVQ